MKQLISRQLPQEPSRQSGPSRVDAVIQIGRFRLLLRRRQLIADGMPIELGTRAFDLLLALLEADGSLVTKHELLGRVLPGIVVAEDNLKTRISALRKALGADPRFHPNRFRPRLPVHRCGPLESRGRPL